MTSHDARQADARIEGLNPSVVASVEIAASPERVFRALTSQEVVDWWIRPGVFDTRTWNGDVRPGGRWQTTGMARGQSYTLEGEYLTVDPPRKLVHTWHLVGTPGAPTTVTYLLEPVPAGTRLTVRHEGFGANDPIANTSAGWDTSLAALARLLSDATRPGAN